jgi:lipopolysaccharide export system ATP-binding protein
MIKPFTHKPKASSIRASADAFKSIVGNKNYSANSLPQEIEPENNTASLAEPVIEQIDLFGHIPEPETIATPEQPKALSLVETPQEATQLPENKEVETPEVTQTLEIVEPEQAIQVEMKSNDNSKVVSINKKTEKKEAPKKKLKPKLIAENAKLGLHIYNLGKSYGGKPAVRDISMYLNRGEAVGLLGPNGAGKTTSFYMIMGLIRPDYGTIALDGVDITKLPVYRRARMGIGYLPQEASIFRGMTVEENILSVLELSEPIIDKRNKALESLLAEFSITHLRRSPAVALSGGERRRVEIARALASNPSFILLDEPLAGIDPVAVADIKELISHLKNRGIGVLITDHNVREALDLVDRAYVIHDGTVLMEGKPSEIVNNKEVRRVYLGEKFVL